jgi:hypothetical protein
VAGITGAAAAARRVFDFAYEAGNVDFRRTAGATTYLASAYSRNTSGWRQGFVLNPLPGWDSVSENTWETRLKVNDNTFIQLPAKAEVHATLRYNENGWRWVTLPATVGRAAPVPQSAPSLIKAWQTLLQRLAAT